jgi:phage-related protein
MVYLKWKEREMKVLDFIGSSRKDIRAFPEEVKYEIGYALFEAQKGKKPAAVNL